MKFHFKKIGPIDDAQLELGDFTIIAGRNNTGKTYLTYTLYGFLKAWRGWPEVVDFLVGPTTTTRDGRGAEFLNFEQAAKELLETGSVHYSKNQQTITKERQLVIQKLTNDFSKHSLARIFSSPSSDFEGASFSVGFDTNFSPNAHTDFSPNAQSLIPRYTIEYNGGSIIIRVGQNLGNRKKSAISRDLARLYYRFLFTEFPEPFILSAERFGIALFHKELDFAKNRIVELLQEMGDEKGKKSFLPLSLMEKMWSRYALAVKDNIDYTRDIPNLRKEKSALLEGRFFDEIKNMMEGYYKNTGDDIRFISKARGERRFDIPLHRASSSARGLSDLYFFLRHKVKKDHLLIIDEPESHLDTTNQRLMARLLSHIVRAGLKVLITTHSDYLVKEINNLIMLNSLSNGKEKIIKDLGYTNNDSLPPEKVRAYIATDNSLSRCDIDEFGIEMPVFDEIIDNINESSNALIAQLETLTEEE